MKVQGPALASCEHHIGKPANRRHAQLHSCQPSYHALIAPVDGAVSAVRRLCRMETGPLAIQLPSRRTGAAFSAGIALP